MLLLLPSRNAIRLAIDGGSPEDYHLVRLYYSWYAGWFYRRRLRMIADLLGPRRLGRVLEIGIGSGIFIKELLQHAEFVTGIDVHPTYQGVRAMLGQEGVDLSRVELRQGDILDIPYADEYFQAVVCISVLEHFRDPRPALREMQRVVQPAGRLVMGFPARNALSDLLFRLLGYDPHEIHPASHDTILAAIRALLSIDEMRLYPLTRLPLYVACRALKGS